MSELTPEDDGLLRLARGANDGSEADRLRVRRKLALQLAAGAGASVALAPASGKIAAWVGTSMKVVATVVAGTAIAAGVMAIRGDWGPHPVKKKASPTATTATTATIAPSAMAPPISTSPPIVNAAPIPIPTTVPVPVPSATPFPTPNPRPTAQPSSVPAVAASRLRARMSLPPDAAPLASSRPVVADVGTEALLLRQADTALRAGDAAAALDFLDKHADAFPNGALREEREVERIIVFCALGRADEARAMVSFFLRSQPHSPLAARVRASCGGP